MKISREDVEKVGHLARLELTPDDVSKFTLQMNSILSYVEKLNELETGSILPTSHAVPLENAFRNDDPVQSIGAENALASAPDRVEDFFRVPKVIE